MRYVRGDFYTLDEAIAYGIRPQLKLSDEDEERWEVYVKLVSGTRVVFASGGTRKQAGKALLRMLRLIKLPTKYLMSTLDDSFVDPQKVVRVYMDGQDNQHVGLVEDVCGESYHIAIGSKAEVYRVVMEATKAVASIQSKGEL